MHGAGYGELDRRMNTMQKHQQECVGEIKRLADEQNKTIQAANDLMVNLRQVLNTLATQQTVLTESNTQLREDLNVSHDNAQQQQALLYRKTDELNAALINTQTKTEQAFVESAARERANASLTCKEQTGGMQTNDSTDIPMRERPRYDEREDWFNWHWPTDPWNTVNSVPKCENANDWWEFRPLPEERSNIQPSSNPVAMINVSITDPPQYSEGKYEIFRKEVVWWRDIHHNISDAQLIGVLAVRIKEDPIKGLMMLFMDQTRACIHNRNPPQLFKNGTMNYHDQHMNWLSTK